MGGGQPSVWPPMKLGMILCSAIFPIPRIISMTRCEVLAANVLGFWEYRATLGTIAWSEESLSREINATSPGTFTPELNRLVTAVRKYCARDTRNAVGGCGRAIRPSIRWQMLETVPSCFTTSA